MTHSEEFAGHHVQVKIMEPEKKLPLANQKMLALLDDWEKTPLPPEEMKILDDFEKFQKERRDRFYSTENTP